jgi:hypothetical protein
MPEQYSPRHLPSPTTVAAQVKRQVIWRAGKNCLNSIDIAFISAISAGLKVSQDMAAPHLFI